MTRQMALVGFLQAQNCTNLPSSWRHPESRDDSMSADYYQEIARILEAGKFHMAFFDDRLAMPDRYGNDHAHTVEYGIRCVKMDPLIVLTTMGMVTTKLGLGSTASTTYFEPFDVARRFATLDLMSGGRAGWNVVTSLNDGEAHNMGKDAHLEHDYRYDRADEFMEVVLGHWDTWEDGSLIMDKKSGRFADPAKVKRLDHKGEYYKSRGPFTVPRSAQGHPVIIQAGASGRGQRFAGRWGEVIFTAARNVAAAKEGYAAVRNEAAKAGRDPDQMRLCNLTTPVCAATKAEAEDKMAVINKLPLEIDALSLLAEALELRLRLQAARRATDIRRPQEHAGHPRHSRRRAQEFRQVQSQRARFRYLLGPRPGARRDRRRPEGSRGQAGRDVRRARLRRLCHRGHHRAGLLRRFRQACRAGIAAPRPVPQGLCRQDAARESRPAAARSRRLENQPAGRGRITRGHFMRWLKFTAAGKTSWGIVEGDNVIAVNGDPFGEWQRGTQSHALKDVKIELPLIPRTFYCVGLNYLKHLKEAADKAGTVPNVPDRPEIGYRAQNALIAHDEDVVIPASATEKIHYEGELVVVIGKKAKHLTEANAMDCVFGYTIGNDVSERTWQKADRGLWRSKNADTFKPMGPWIETDVDLDKMETVIRVNGKETGRFHTNDMIFGIVPFLVELTKYFTLSPGDVIWMGTDGASPNLKAGDVVEIDITGIGTLRNKFVAEKV